MSVAQQPDSLEQSLRVLGTRLRAARLSRAIAITTLVIAAGFLLFSMLDIFLGLRFLERTILSIAIMTGLAVLWLRVIRPLVSRRESMTELAVLADRELKLDSDLIAAWQFASDPDQGHLRQSVISRGNELARQNDFEAFVPHPRWNRWWGAALLSLGLGLIMVVGFPAFASAAVQRFFFQSVAYPTRTRIAQLEFAAHSYEITDSQLIVHTIVGRTVPIRIQAEGQLPANGNLRLRSAGRETSVRFEPEAQAPDWYRASLLPQFHAGDFTIELGDARLSGQMQIRELPHLELAIQITPPSYTGAAIEESKSLRLAAWENSAVSFKIKSQKPLQEAIVSVYADNRRLDLQMKPMDSAKRHWQSSEHESLSKITQAFQFSVTALDVHGLRPDDTMEGFVNIRPDGSPSASVKSEFSKFLPGGKPSLEITADDDFRLGGVTLRINREDNGKTLHQYELLAPSEAKNATLPYSAMKEVELGTIPIKAGNSLQIVATATDSRGPLSAKSFASQPMVIEIVDDAAFRRVLAELDSDCDHILEQIEQQQLTFLESPPNSSPVASTQLRSSELCQQWIDKAIPKYLRYLRQNQTQESLADDLEESVQRVANLKREQIIPLLESLQGTKVTMSPQMLAKARQILIAIGAERQRIAQRMKFAGLVSRLRRLIEQQAKLLKSAEANENDAPTENDRIESQRFVYQLYLQFVETLNDVRSWNNSAARQANRLLVAATQLALQSQFESALRNLEKQQFQQAQQNQEAIESGLRALLAQALQGDRLPKEMIQQWIDALEKLIAEQTDIEKTARAKKLAADAADRLTERETRLHRQISDVMASSASITESQPLLRQAKQHASGAMEALFEQRSREAANAAKLTNESLKRAKAVFEDHLSQLGQGNSAQALLRRIQQLARLLSQLPDQLKAIEAAGDNPQQIVKALQSTAQLLRASAADFSGEFAETLAQLERNMSQVAQQVENDSLTDDLKQQIASIVAKLRRARWNTLAHLRATQRQHPALDAGELARGAEILERLASAQRSWTDALSDQDEQPSGKHLTQTAGILQQLDDALGTDRIELKSSINAARQAVLQLQSQSADSASGGNAARKAKSAGIASDLSALANEYRKTIQKVAKALIETSAEQTEQSLDLSVKLEQAIAPLAKAQARTQKLHDLNRTLQQARMELDLTAGRDAVAKQRANGLKMEALRNQALAIGPALNDFLTGDRPTPLQAITMQQALSQALSRIEPSEGQDQANSTHELSEAAARDLLAGRWQAAKQKQAAIARQLQAIRQSLEPQGEELKRFGELSRQAQKRLATALAAFRDHAAQVESGRLDELAQELAQTSDIAGEAIREKDRKRAENALNQLTEGLNQTQAAINDSLQTANQQLTGQISKSQAQTAQLNDAVRAMSPAGATELRRAQATTQNQSVANPLLHADHAGKTFASVARLLKIQRDEIQADENRGTEFIELAKAQQKVRDETTKHRETLLTLHRDHGDSILHDQEQQQLAKQLQQAVQRFESAQVTLGKHAAKTSQQSEVGNQSLRDALRLAGQLSYPPSTDSVTDEKSTENSAGQNSGENANSNDSDPKSKAPAIADVRNMGQQLVPRSADVTAKQLAGKALQLASKMLKDSDSSDQPSEPGRSQNNDASSQANNDNQTNQENKPSSEQMANQGASNSQGTLPANVTNQRRGDEGLGPMVPLEQQTWFTQLPPAIQQAIQSRSRRPAPRAYRKRLQQYFRAR